MLNKDKYAEFCSSELALPIFYQPWWLNAVCEKGTWNVILFEKDNSILGIYPYLIKDKYMIFSVITMPPFTPFLGPYLIYPENQKNFERISFEKEVLNCFISELPQFDKFIQLFNFNFSNWLPFYWNNFEQTTYYSYLIENISDLEKVRTGFHPNKLREIKKAEKEVRIKFDLSPEEFYGFHKKSLEKTGEKISYSFEFFKSIFEAASANNSGKIVYATDNEKIFSVLFFVWDKNSGYTLIGSKDPDLKKSGSFSLLIWEAIKYLSSKTIMFNLSGSMNENYEFSYRQFGGVQKQYFYVTKTKSFLLKLSENILKH